MNKISGGIACALIMSHATPSMTLAAPLKSGIDTQYAVQSIRPQDDFYQYVNGKWLAETPIPAGRARYGVSDKLADDSLDQVHAILDELRNAPPADAEQRKAADLYASFMDEAAPRRVGLKPLAAQFARINALKSASEIPALIAYLNRMGVTAPYSSVVHQDAKEPGRNVFDLIQSGLGMPDRDYYLLSNTKLIQIRAQYLQHMQKMLSMMGDKSAAGDAKKILELETALAKQQWTNAENRSRIKTYNQFSVDKLQDLAPGYNWTAYLTDAGVIGKIDKLNIRQPSYITGFNQILQSTPLSVWKAYFRWHVLSDFSPDLSEEYVDEHFTFYGSQLRGIQKDEARWMRGVAVVERQMGEALGKIFVAKYVPPEAKERVEQLVKNLLLAYQADIRSLDWLGPETRQKALDKLSGFGYKIGYPDKWRDYSGLKIVRTDLIGNLTRGNEFEYRRNLDKLDKPVDRTEWRMTPQTVNGYYSAERNEIVFPAAILRPPYFDPDADDAVNYGAIGGIIGHEISHGFDDQGSQYDGDGVLLSPPGWFTQEDLDRFKARTHALVEQYSAYSPVAGFHVNGEMTLGENIADNSGIAIAYKAYRLSLAGGEAPVIDNLTGDQRFFMAWAQVWRSKIRDTEAIRRIKTDPHSPADIRATAPVRNQRAFYDAFGVKPGDKMYLDPEQRVSLW